MSGFSSNPPGTVQSGFQPQPTLFSNPNQPAPFNNFPGGAPAPGSFAPSFSNPTFSNPANPSSFPAQTGSLFGTNPSTSFGGNNSNFNPSPTGLFGNAATGFSNPTSAGFGTGQSGLFRPNTTGGFGTNNTPPVSTPNVFGQGNNTGGLFGMNQNTGIGAPSPAFAPKTENKSLFGTNPNPSPGFAPASNTGFVPASNTGFAANNPNSANPAGLFGNNPPVSSGPAPFVSGTAVSGGFGNAPSLFGNVSSGTANTPASSTGLFGNVSSGITNTPTSTTGLFGTGQSNPGLFANSVVPPTSNTGLFSGISSGTAGVSAPALFSSSNPSTPGLFGTGSQVSNPIPASSLFTNPTSNPPPSSTSLFAPATSTQPISAPSLFAPAISTQPISAPSLFTNPSSTQPPPSTSLFSSSQPSLFTPSSTPNTSNPQPSFSVPASSNPVLSTQSLFATQPVPTSTQPLFSAAPTTVPALSQANPTPLTAPRSYVPFGTPTSSSAPLNLTPSTQPVKVEAGKSIEDNKRALVYKQRTERFLTDSKNDLEKQFNAFRNVSSKLLEFETDNYQFQNDLIRLNEMLKKMTGEQEEINDELAIIEAEQEGFNGFLDAVNKEIDDKSRHLRYGLEGGIYQEAAKVSRDLGEVEGQLFEVVRQVNKVEEDPDPLSLEIENSLDALYDSLSWIESKIVALDSQVLKLQR